MEKRTPFKELSKQDKASYIWDYYKWPIIIGIVAIMLISSVVKSITTHKDPNLAVIMINSQSKDSTVFEEMLSSFQDNNLVLLNANLSFNEEGNSTGFYLDDTVLSAQLNSETYDLFFGNGGKYEYCASEGYMIDLSTVLPEEVFDSIPKDHLLYTTVGDRIEAYPCAVLLDNCNKLEDYYPDGPFYCGILYNDPNPGAAAKVIEILLSE